ncbi:uracil-DNA glycosylase [Knoellia sinensis KCTC 19936]|uniref:Uracil-DNA glycosylase n=2 Tax=Knoellia TaxID=136099 RepID=A0A0A0IZQ5_9MICO|nr:uracil-DNA glycosylase [Knoellia sinensis KCTC 19936]
MTSDWDALLDEEASKQYWNALQDYVLAQRALGPVYPPQDQVFAALRATPLDRVRVVILGQDPYPGTDEANGLAFSVGDGVDAPGSLRNIFKELESDLGTKTPNHGNLTHWANQGVLLLNTVLTVRAGERHSHKGRGWETFTEEALRAVSAKDEPVVFMLWGNKARAKRKLIAAHHEVIESSHPSGISAYRTSAPFFTSRPFSRANTFLKTRGRGEVDWQIPDLGD